MRLDYLPTYPLYPPTYLPTYLTPPLYVPLPPPLPLPQMLIVTNVAEGKSATYRGTGFIKAIGNVVLPEEVRVLAKRPGFDGSAVKFTMTAVDGGPGHANDKLRMRIYESTNNGRLLYDNMRRSSAAIVGDDEVDNIMQGGVTITAKKSN